MSPADLRKYIAQAVVAAEQAHDADTARIPDPLESWEHCDELTVWVQTAIHDEDSPACVIENIAHAIAGLHRLADLYADKITEEQFRKMIAELSPIPPLAAK